MRAALLTIGSLVLTAAVIGNAYYQKKQFYPSVVYITKSNPSMAVIYIQAFVLVLLMGKVMRKVFFGQLRAAEMEHLIERSWYAVTETCLAFTVFRDDFSPKFVALFTLLLFLKCFHWLAEDRVDYMERSPVISWLFHLRVISLLSLLGLLDYLFVSHAYYSTLTRGASVQLVFGFEYAILLTIIGNIFVKYVLHTIDLQSENPWEDKAVYLLYTELVIGFLKVVLYLSFMTIMIKIHTFPLFAIRPMYLSMRAFKKAFNDVIMSRRAIRNMNTLYPDATTEELATVDNVCIICREEMTGGGSSKKLPCNHIFHASCLRSWFQRQQTCPTCRMDVLRVPNTSPGGLPVAHGVARENIQRAPEQQQLPQNPLQMPNWPGFIPGAFPAPFPFWMPLQPPQQPPQQQQAAGGPPGSTPAAPSPVRTQEAPDATPPAGPTPSAASAGQSSMGDAGTGVSGTAPAMSGPCLIPPFAFMPFLIPPPPLPSADLGGLTDEELRELEGQERENIEARIRCLRNIQTFLDAAVLQMQQYSTAMVTGRNPSTMGSPEPFPSPSSSSSTTAPSAPPPASEGLGATAAATNSHSTVSSVPLPESTLAKGGPSSSTAAGAEKCSVPDTDASTSSVGGANEDADIQEQLRRRRLQRFGQEQNGKVGTSDRAES